MAGKGGPRTGAGRKAGKANQKTREIADRAASEGITPLEYMLKVLREEPSPDLPDEIRMTMEARRMDAAKAAAPYMHPRLQQIQSNVDANVALEVVTGVPSAQDSRA
jgi:hypothetical protein